MSWVRTQRVALIALLCSALATAGVYLWLDVLPVAEAGDETIVTASDGAAAVAGQELVLGEVRWNEFPAPAGSRSLSIRMRSSGGPDAAICGTVTLSEQHGERTWLDADDLIDIPSEDGEPYCISESAPYDIVSVFALPADADGPFYLDIAGEDHRAARFLIEP
ncbi:hypothetical protein [Microbacterium nymphoidis]|uniref:hypothetical protein n=1 Tax=Microbacterium nymphoidis TaxID=2898586 RepID=UPI001E532291|nr:hypothetical protein [Microbacterium nymphoidis]MCD2498113.1 hypothetical protein [Microbacterium nymphoidis]